MSEWKQGKVRVTPDMGYNGKNKTIRFMSSWELNAFKKCIRLFKAGRLSGWNSEETQFEYLYAVDQKTHRYYMDLTLVDTNGKVIFVEIKPYSEHACAPRLPKGGRMTESYQRSVLTWTKNQCKWQAVKEWVENENAKLPEPKYKFVIWDEYTLGIKKRPNMA